MRNLKRALCLALASVMLLGMMAVGASATSYPDVADENNVEAIAVLKEVGAMIGDENGNFNPDKPVTRNEMAAVVARLLYGAAAEDYTGTVPFTDVPEWAVKYVAACYDNGIVTGRDETTYDGNGTVKAQEAATMMLRALGYEKITDTGADWAKRAVAEANKISLFKGVTGNVVAELTRNDVAQLSLNTLKSTMVTTKSSGTVTIGDATINVGELEYPKQYSDESYADTIKAGTQNSDNQYTLELGEKLYEGKLELADGNNVTDNFGRMATTWKYDGKDIITVAKDAKKAYVGGVKSKDVYAGLGLSTDIALADISYYEDGVSAAAPWNITKNGGDKDKKFGADGQSVETFVYTRDDDTKAAIVVVINTCLGIVTDDDVHEDDKDGIDITVYGTANAGVYFYETGLYEKGDVLLLQIADESGDHDGSDMQIQAILGEPETVSGSVTRIGKDLDLTIDKVKYPKAAQFAGNADNDVIKGVSAINSTNVEISADASYTLYLDRNGNFLAVVEDENSKTTTDLVYVFDKDVSKTVVDGKVVTGAYATVVFMDGTYKEVLIGETVGSEATPDDSSIAVGTLMTLKYDEDDDEYTLDPVLTDYTNMAIVSGTGIELKADSKYAKLAGSSNSSYYLSRDTVYIFVSKDDDGKIDKVERYVGGVDYDIESGTTGVFATDAKKNADYVVIGAAYSASAKDIVYISSSTAQGKEEAGILFKGYKDGGNKEELLAVKKILGVDATMSSTPSGFYQYSLTDKGGMKLTALSGTYTGKKVLSVSASSLIDVGNAKPHDASGVKVVDLTDATKAAENTYGRAVTSVSTIKNLLDRYDFTVSIYVNSDNEVEALFITNIANKA